MSDWQQDVEKMFNRAACERLARSNREYQDEHGYYIVPLAALLNATRDERDRLAARIAELERERDEAVQEREEWFRQHQALAADHYFRRAEQVERARDDAREALRELTCYVEVDALHPELQDRIDAALAADPEPRPPADTDRFPPEAMNEHDPRL